MLYRLSVLPLNNGTTGGYLVLPFRGTRWLDAALEARLVGMGDGVDVAESSHAGGYSKRR